MRILLSALAASAALAAASPGLAQDAPEGGAWTDCPVTSVAVYRDRLELKCGGPAGAETPRVFAIEMVDRMMDPVLRMSLEAKARGKPLSVLYVKSAIANPGGCSQETCRRMVGVESK